jgi:cellulose biosynthesis protein BcsQ
VKEELFMLITIANQKGGTGKTAIANLLTSFLLEIPKNTDKIFPCDMDEQRSFARLTRILFWPPFV